MNEKETLIKADIISFLKVIASSKQSTANPLCCYCTVANGECNVVASEGRCKAWNEFKDKKSALKLLEVEE